MIKYILGLGIILIVFNGQSFGQKHSFCDRFLKLNSKQANPMGLWDMGVSLGYLNLSENYSGSSLGGANSATNCIYTFVHFQESLLCNYLWSDKPDKKIKFGFQETLDMGMRFGKFKQTYKYQGSDTIEVRNANAFVGAYEAGLASVFKINHKMDAGITYYPFIASTFTSNPATKYVKLRYRYDHYMCEISLKGKKAIDLRYIKESLYFGLCYMGFNDVSNQRARSAHYLHLSIGYCF